MKSIYITLTALVLFLSINLQAQPNKPNAEASLTFTEYADLPQRVINSSYASDGQYLYSLNGRLFNKRISPSILRLNPATNQWQQVSNQLVPKTNAASVYVSSVHKIYVMGGIKPLVNALFFNVETIDTQTGEVKVLKTENPNPQVNCALAVWENKIYLFGGSSEGYGSARLYEFDVATEKFKRLKDMPITAQTEGAVIDGILYTFGGYNPYNNFTFDEIYAYDIQANTWKQVGKLPKKVSATSIAVQGKNIFVTGSFGDPDFVGYFNTQTKEFTKLKSNLEGRRFASSGIIGNQLFVYGGSSTVIDPGVIKVQAADVSQLN